MNALRSFFAEKYHFKVENSIVIESYIMIELD